MSKQDDPIGLDRAIAAETVLSHSDPESGQLLIRGYSLESLVQENSFEESVITLWQDVLSAELSMASLGQARMQVWQQFRPLQDHLKGMRPVERQRFLLSSLSETSTDPVLILAAAGVSAVLAMQENISNCEPDPSRSHADDLLMMIRGAESDQQSIAALETYLIAMIDHGISASTLAARVAASTRAGYVAAAIAALSVLQGPLHGGAPGLVLDMLDEIGSGEGIVPWLTAALDRGDRLMGFGSRAYRVPDPRAALFKASLWKLPEACRARLPLAEQVETTAIRLMAERKAGHVIQTNVEYYAALLLDAIGVPRQGFTPLFAASRTAGWMAHAREQQLTGRMLRPGSRYIGSYPSKG
ncbi:citrate/2-methylcitrate synthase [Fodinicurvata halophila]|uniref:citrate synthase (unknown stereospecificity) n=1 Tax=Fodinicurvata halophila TaxID=1419723 RepID=A0ABV8UQN3_9PROT